MTPTTDTPAGEVASHDLFALVPLYDETESQFYYGQKHANEDFVKGTKYGQDMKFMNADVQAGYSYERQRLEKIRKANS